MRIKQKEITDMIIVNSISQYSNPSVKKQQPWWKWLTSAGTTQATIGNKCNRTALSANPAIHGTNTSATTEPQHTTQQWCSYSRCCCYQSSGTNRPIMPIQEQKTRWFTRRKTPQSSTIRPAAFQTCRETKDWLRAFSIIDGVWRAERILLEPWQFLLYKVW